MADCKARWRFEAREWRFLIYLLVLGFAGWKYIPRPWHPALTVQTSHHTIYSTASPQETEHIGRPLELLYASYSNRFAELPDVHKLHGKLQVKLYKDRDEMRKVHPNMGWAEAFYSAPYCHAYFSAKEINPYHWMLHESVHQLNHEFGHLTLAKWLEEGLAAYFSTSRLLTNELAIGRIDPNTYPVWWIELIAQAPTLEQNISNKSVIPLRAIIENRGGPSMNSQFNLYYLHWWTLTHFVFEDERYRSKVLKLAQQGGGLAAFEQTIGPVERVQAEWHEYVRQLKKTIEGTDPQFLKTGRISPSRSVNLRPPAKSEN